MLKPSVCRSLFYNLFNTSNKRYSSVKILGIETSCDDTGVAIVDSNGNIHGESLYSQQSLHAQLGGIIPPIARDNHEKNIVWAVEEALGQAKLSLNEVDALAVTTRPGLPLSLAVGTKYAKKLALANNKPLISVHHMEAHALTIRMIEKVEFPFLVLLISGGHSLLVVAKDVNKFLLLGKTLDDAPGEALDKIARRLKLNNINGEGSDARNLEKIAKEGDPYAFDISEPLLHSRDCNFSFAGIKNSTRRVIIEQEEKYNCIGDMVLPTVANLCASVQFAVLKHLIRRVQRAMEYCDNGLIPIDKQSLVVSGGVASNKMIRRALENLCEHRGYKCFIPPPKLCTDNGVMIAWNGVENFLARTSIFNPDQLDLVDIRGKCSLGEDISNEVEEAKLKIARISPKVLLRERKV